MKITTVCFLLLVSASVFGADSTLINYNFIGDALLNCQPGNEDLVSNNGTYTDLVASTNKKLVIHIDSTTLADSLGAYSSFDSMTFDFTTPNPGVAAADTVRIYPLLKPVYVDSCTCNDWDARTASNFAWGSAGADSASDSGTKNTANGDDYDRLATPFGKIYVATAGASYRIAFSATDAEKWADFTIVGLVIEVIGSGNLRINSVENATEGNRPLFTWYGAKGAAGGTTLARRRRIQIL